jgi:hypothetical protein
VLSGGVHDLVGHGVATDDPDRCRFAKVGEGFDKWLKRQAIPGGLTAIWVRERLSGGSAEVVHCHMLQGLANAVCFRGANWFTTTRVGASDAIQSKQIMANEDPPVSLAPIWRDLPCFTRNDSICRSNRDHPVRIKTRQR